MPRCRVCAHPDREAIERELLSGKSLRYIAICYDISHGSVFRHKREHSPAAIVEARAAGGAALAVGGERAGHLVARVEATLARLDKLSGACDEFLAGPDPAGRDDLARPSSELVVRHTTVAADGSPRAVRARLSDLLDSAGSNVGGPVQPVAIRVVDPRELVLKVARRLETQIRFLGRFAREIEEPAVTQSQGSLITSPEWTRTRSALIAALEPYPDAREAVVRAFAEARAPER